MRIRADVATFFLKGAIAAALVLSCTVPALADDVFRVTVPTANVREEPNTGSAVVGRAERGTVLRIIAVEQDWVRVVLPAPDGLEKVGYIMAALGRVETIPGLAPPVATAPAPATPASAAAVPRPEPAVVEPPPAAALQAPPAAPVVQPAPTPTVSGGFVRREPVVALLLSALWPGVGQFYNGPTEQKKGLIMAGAAVGSLILAFSSASEGSGGGAGLGLLGYAGVSIYSIYDAVTRAGELNREHGLALTIEPESLGGQTGVRASVGYTFAF